VNATLAAIGGYLVIQFAIGIWVSRGIKTEDDYLVAGRKLGYPLAIFSIFATWFGAETIVGAAGRSAEEGLSLASAEPFGYGLCLMAMGLIFAVPLWRRRLTTLADLFSQRYSTTVERVAAIILIPGSVLWAAAQVRAFGHVLASSSSLDVEPAIAFAAFVTIAYTIFGGLLVDAITDVLQGVMLVIGLVVIGVAAVVHLGGPVDAIHAAAAANRTLLAHASPTSLPAALEAWAIPVCGSVVATELVARIIAARSPTVARRSSIAAGTMYVAVGLIPVFLGLAGASVVTELGDPEQVIPAMAERLLPTALYAVFAGGLISAILSTVDSTLLVASSLLSHNIVVPLLRTPTERTKVRVARAGVFTFGIMAYVLAHHAEGVFALVEQASAFGSAGSLVVVVFGLFTRWGGATTALVTLLTGMGSYLLGVILDVPYPFLLSLGTALTTYVVGAVLGAAYAWKVQRA